MDNNQTLHDKFQELSCLYAKAKERVLLAETITGQTIVSCLNEMRNAFDHLMRIDFNDNKSILHEVGKASSHVYRATYDAYEVIAIFVMADIKRNLSDFSPSHIAQVLPEYYREIIPQIKKLEEGLANARAQKVDVINNTTAFTKYDEELIPELLKLHEKINSIVPGLTELKNNDKDEQKRKNVKSLVVGLGLGILGSLIAAIIYSSLAG